MGIEDLIPTSHGPEEFGAAPEELDAGPGSARQDPMIGRASVRPPEPRDDGSRRPGPTREQTRRRSPREPARAGGR